MQSGNCYLPVNQHAKNWFDLSKITLLTKIAFFQCPFLETGVVCS